VLPRFGGRRCAGAAMPIRHVVPGPYARSWTALEDYHGVLTRDILDASVRDGTG